MGAEVYGSPNALAYLIFFGWLPLSLVVFAVARPMTAAMIAYLGGILFLPERLDFDLPLLPPVGKGEVAVLSALLGSLWRMPQRFRGVPLGKSRIALAVIVGSSVVTTMSNRDVLVFGETVLQAHEAGESIGLAVRELLQIGLPFFLGCALFRSEEDLRTLLVAFLVGAVAYSPLIMLELRVSPQLHRWIYGYHQHFFAQTVRAGGYRPMVFLQHGLAVAMFMLAAVIAAFTAHRAKLKVFGYRAGIFAGYLLLLLVACKSAGALVLALVVLPASVFTLPGKQLRLAWIFSLVVIAYPLSKVAEVFPNEQLVDVARTLFSAERAQSLEFRFDNDVKLVERAKERQWFGWGTYGRARVYDIYGKDTSVTDGYWIIQFGNRGLVGLFSNFALLLLPILVLRRRFKKIAEPKVRGALAGVALMVVVYTLDLLPNGLYNSVPFFLAGALLGLVMRLSRPLEVATAAGRG